MRTSLLLTVLVTTVLAAAPAAQAGFFAGEPLDGPSADLVRVDDADLARDGRGAVVYVRREGGVDHVFARRLVRGGFAPAERLDPGLPGPAGAASVAASDGGRLVVTYVAGGQAFAVVRTSARASWTAPQPLGAGATATAVDMSINGAAYAVFTTGGDLRAARLDRRGSAFALLPSPLDIDPAADAGAGSGRPQVAVSADGTAVAVWAEAGRVWERRLTGLDVSPVPQTPVLAALEGHRGGAADLPEVDVEDDSSYAWVVFRQQFADGAGTTARGIARRLRGSRFEDPVVVDGLGWGGPSVDATAIDLTARGDGLVATGGSDGVARVTGLRADLFGAVVPVGGGGTPSQPVVATSESRRRLAAWIAGGDPVTVHARPYQDSSRAKTPAAPGADVLLADPALGPVDPGAGLVAASDRGGDALVAFVQAGADGRRLVTAGFDLPPGAPGLGEIPAMPLATKRPVLRWRAARDAWGPVTYSVEVDGRVVGTTARTSFTAGPLRNGRHRWRVLAVDRHGATAAGPRQVLVVKVKGRPGTKKAPAR